MTPRPLIEQHKPPEREQCSVKDKRSSLEVVVGEPLTVPASVVVPVSDGERWR